MKGARAERVEKGEMSVPTGTRPPIRGEMGGLRVVKGGYRRAAAAVFIVVVGCVGGAERRGEGGIILVVV